MLVLKDNNRTLYLVALAILITRIPFLFSGFGSEEDAWGLILTARNISLSGVYEVSRMPGHPVQELMLSQMWELPSWLLNFFTAIASSLGILFFMFSLRELKIRNVVPAGIALAFVPVFYINSTNIMDYAWTLSLVLIALYMVVRGNIISASVILGVACGFRITAGAMVIPFSILIYYQDKSLKKIFFLGFVTTCVAIICFLPAYFVYGTSFFTYYEYFPYPPFLKNVYKGTVGAWGVVGLVAVAAAAAVSIVNWMKTETTEKNRMLPVILMSIATIALYTYSFLKIPQKSAFVLPMAPFVIILFSIFLSRKMMWVFSAALIISCFFMGINLDDPLRGSMNSSFAYRTTVGNTPVSVDLFSGIVIADATKREQKITYAKTLVDELGKLNEKTLIIAGWWQNELNYFSLNKKNPLVTYVYYVDENELHNYTSQQYKIYYLPEQDFYNDLRFNGAFTKKYASAFD